MIHNSIGFYMQKTRLDKQVKTRNTLLASREGSPVRAKTAGFSENFPEGNGGYSL